jgi:sugar/nucleoside kinase (ribokinase family)
MVWDRIDHPAVEPVERWGGIAYSLAAASAALPDGWTIRPIVRLGRDLAPSARAFLDAVPGLERPGGIREVAEPNNRVRLRYRDAGHRDEQLTGGVGPWRWDELAPALEGLDALYVNLISGFELDLDSATRLRDVVGGPLYVDLHSLLLGMGPEGRRVPRRLPRRDAWLDAFDLIQANERELALVAGDDHPDAVARAAVRRGRGAVLVTRGPEGATWYAAGDRPRPWEARAGAPGATGADEVRCGSVPVVGSWTGDPTGCGDVWGTTCFLALLAGERLAAAVEGANQAASRNVAHRGADGLHHHLRRIGRVGPERSET